MSAKMAQAEVKNEAENNQSSIEAAKGAVEQAMKDLDMAEHREQWLELQRRFFDLEAARLARDDEFQNVELDGTRLNVPHVHRPLDEPVVEDDNGEWEVPTRNDSFRVLDGIQVADPDNPHTTHAVTIDHVIETGGDVRVEVNALPLEKVAKEQGSHIR